MLSVANIEKLVKLTFQQWLRLMRDRAGLSQKDIADALDVKIQTVGNWEGGRSIPKLTPQQTFILCEMLGVSLAALAQAFQGEIELGGDEE